MDTPIARFDTYEDLVPDDMGEWVRYEDHVAALEQARAEATEAAYAEMRRRWDATFGAVHCEHDRHVDRRTP